MFAKITFISLLCVFIAALGLLLKKQRHKKQQALIPSPPPASVTEEFSGDNRWETELDLAKAYMELHDNDKAKILLKSVITHGDPAQIAEARRMFTSLLRQGREIKASIQP